MEFNGIITCVVSDGQLGEGEVLDEYKMRWIVDEYKMDRFLSYLKH